jgi:hypothetical protein
MKVRFSWPKIWKFLKRAHERRIKKKMDREFKKKIVAWTLSSAEPPQKLSDN